MNVTIITLLKEGGMVHYTSQMSNHLVEHVNVNLIVPEECNLEYFKKEINIRTVKTPPRGGWMSIEQFNIIKLFKIINNLNSDIVHISGSYMWVIGLFFLLKLKKYPTVITLHDVNTHYGEDIFINKLTNYFYLKSADHILVHGEKVKQELLQKGVDETKVSVIPHGDYSFFTEYGKKNVKEDNSILFFGRIEDYKGLEYLLRAIPLIQKKVDNFNVIIAGRGNLEKYNHLIKEHSNIEIFNEYIEDDLVAELFHRASVVVMPYIEGSQSGIIPIAYAFRKPVVVTDVGSIPEVVDDGITGFVVPPKDSKTLAEAVIKILKDDKLRKQMGDNAYILMREYLSWNEISKKIIEIYKKTINDES
jgi:starch synthase